MPRKTTTASAAKPVSLDLAGLMGPQIAELVISGDLSQAQAEQFVAERAVRKFGKALDKARQA